MTTRDSKPELDPLAALQAENARLVALLDANGIEWHKAATPTGKDRQTRRHERRRMRTVKKPAFGGLQELRRTLRSA